MEPEELAGEYLYLDCEYPDQFGHNLLELWPLLWVRDIISVDTKVITSVDITDYVIQTLAALGFNHDRIVTLDRPVICESLIIVTPPIQLREYVHPVAFNVYDTIKKAAAPYSSPGPYGEKLYLSRRRSAGRPLVNEEEVEDTCAARGYSVVYPESMTWAEQIRMFSRARRMIGPGGSAIHNAVYLSPEVAGAVLVLLSPHWFNVIDALLSAGRFHLSYLIGEAVDKPDFRRDHRDWRPWKIDLRSLHRVLDRFDP
jgi:capsular polysaccharide biosynthesis protein